MVRRCTCIRGKQNAEVGTDEKHGSSKELNAESLRSIYCQCAKNVQRAD